MNHVRLRIENRAEGIAGIARRRAGKTLRHLDWFEMTQVRGQLNDDGSIAYYQVMLKVGFRLE